MEVYLRGGSATDSLSALLAVTCRLTPGRSAWSMQYRWRADPVLHFGLGCCKFHAFMHFTQVARKLQSFIHSKRWWCAILRVHYLHHHESAGLSPVLLQTLAGCLCLLKIWHHGSYSAGDKGQKIVVHDLHQQPETYSVRSQIPPDGAPQRAKDCIWQHLCTDCPRLEEVQD